MFNYHTIKTYGGRVGIPPYILKLENRQIYLFKYGLFKDAGSI
jgi:hypothetical protein